MSARTPATNCCASPRRGRFFAFTVHSAVYERMGFVQRFAALGHRIEAFATEPFRIYGPDAEGAHAGDTGSIVSFRKR